MDWGGEGVIACSYIYILRSSDFLQVLADENAGFLPELWKTSLQTHRLLSASISILESQ